MRRSKKRLRSGGGGGPQCAPPHCRLPKNEALHQLHGHLGSRQPRRAIPRGPRRTAASWGAARGGHEATATAGSHAGRWPAPQ
eukprot:3883007-Pyramimonas_sp.AAC.1